MSEYRDQAKYPSGGGGGGGEPDPPDLFAACARYTYGWSEILKNISEEMIEAESGEYPFWCDDGLAKPIENEERAVDIGDVAEWAGALWKVPGTKIRAYVNIEGKLQGEHGMGMWKGLVARYRPLYSFNWKAHFKDGGKEKERVFETMKMFKEDKELEK